MKRGKQKTVPIHDASDIYLSRKAGGLAAKVLAMLTPHVQPGISTGELDKLCHDYIVNELQCVPTNVGYYGFPKTVCTSVNHVICHGIPDDKQILKDGDIINVDVAVTTPEGWIGDTSRMYYVGQPSNLARRLVNTTYEALVAGIRAVVVVSSDKCYENREQLHNLTHDIHSLRNPSLLIGVDHEGGRIQRFREEFTKIPSARSLGQLYDTDPQRAHNLTAACGLVMASELRACGVDFTFAPCLDLDYGQSAVIGNRAFHRNPRVVSILATAMVSGMAQAGMACCGKHFPGHGDTATDSHLALPTITVDPGT